jgi:hypothetical protein
MGSCKCLLLLQKQTGGCRGAGVTMHALLVLDIACKECHRVSFECSHRCWLAKTSKDSSGSVLALHFLLLLWSCCLPQLPFAIAGK